MIVFLLLCYIGLSSLALAATCTLRQSQYEALESIYIESDGENWNVPSNQTKWTFPSSVNAPCNDNWTGITCSCSQQTNQFSVIELSLSDYDMRGIISPSIGNLTNLQTLILFGNYLRGTVPSEIGQLSLLQYLDLGANQLVGSIPSEIGQLTALHYLYINVNQLIGSIPSAIGQLSLLLELYLNVNQFTGTLPSEIGQLSSLRTLDLNYNLFTGSILTEIGKLSLLLSFYPNYNKFTGSIPSEIGQLAALQYFDCGSNELTGTIPSAIAQLTSLRTLDLDTNQLIGSIPSEISQLSLLRTLDLGVNLLTGSIPSEIGQLSLLQYLYLNSNLLSDRIPSSLCGLPLLRFLYLYENALTSAIPKCFGQVSSLLSLAIQSNHLSSTIPVSLSNLTSLVSMFLNDNHFSGTFLHSIGSLASVRQISISNNFFSGNIFPNVSTKMLTTLNIANNLFTGAISDNIFQSGLLTALVAPGNCLFGSIPETVCNVADKNMTIFDFSNSGSNSICPDNQRIRIDRIPAVHGTLSQLGLSGTIPSCLLTSSSMTALRLSGNRLHGSLPSSISSSSIQLVNLTLAYNSLTGSIPDWIQRHSFQELDLSNNRLDGTLSSDFMVSAYQSRLGLAVNRLSGDLPSSIIEASSNMSSLNVLAGNIFACKNDDLPSQDPSADSYSCGSYELYVSSYTWLGFAGSFLLVGIIFYLVAYRYKIVATHNQFYQRLIAWSTAASKIFDKPMNKNADISQAWVSRFQLFPETITFLMLIRFAPQLIFCIGLVLVCIALPTYIGLHSVSSIVTYDYGYVISMANLHDIQPVIFIGTLLLFLFMLVIYAVKSFLAFLDNIFVSYRTRAVSVSITSANGNPLTWRQYLIFMALNLVNLVVVMTVNIAYVNTIINSTNYNRDDLLLIQVGVSMFKILWNSFYVPWSCDWLATFSSHRRSMQNRFIMSIISFIIAPVISTIVYSESCFYFVFNSAEKVSSNVSLTLDDFGFCESGACLISFPISINSTSVSSFDYSYACGQALIVAYTPVLILSYLFSGLFRPAFLILAFDNPISKIMFHISNYPTMIPSPYRPKLGVKGRDIIVRLMVHSTVLITFGLAAPILAIPIVFAVVMDCSTYRLLVGKTLYENDVEVMEDPNHQTAVNPIVKSDEAKINTSPDHTFDANKHRSIRADLLTMEHLDMASSWQAIDACFHLMITFVMQFWALLFFDMIADVYGVINGIITMTCFAILPAVFMIALNKSNLILRILSKVGLSIVFDRYLANMTGLDMSQWSASSSSPAADHSIASIDAMSSSSRDVEMIATSRMHNNDSFVAEDRQEVITIAIDTGHD
jgi:Leucine-rich repeat (LRR) protein